MVLTPEDTKRFQTVIEGPLKDLLTGLYDSYMTNYFRFRNRIGPQCPLCKSAARTMFALEVKRKGDDFLTRWRSGDWNGYS